MRIVRNRRSAPKVLISLLVSGLLLLCGCTVPRPEVSFYGNRTSVRVQPLLYCNDQRTSCPVDSGRTGHLTMRKGQPLQVSVPTEIGDTVWVVLFEYRDASNKPASGRSEIFTDKRLAYTLPTLGAGTQLTKVEVQAGITVVTDTAGNQQFQVSSSWVLEIDAATA